MDAEARSYPIGRFHHEGVSSRDERARSIRRIAELPREVRAGVDGISAAEWDRTYRDGGWTVRQLVHHLPDSHANAFIRFKLGLTEESPTIRPYDQAAWARLPDVAGTPPPVSLDFLEALHARWTVLLAAMTEADFARTIVHPEHPAAITLDWMLAQYDWHGRHHLGHIRLALGRQAP
ncbi:MAG TPA: putative metal-dependent hydrolase [Thermoanaerobaculia bacterium]|nr:putative metal-dependent hydrolase [Thermoanaerobaculia bacterium]